MCSACRHFCRNHTECDSNVAETCACVNKRTFYWTLGLRCGEYVVLWVVTMCSLMATSFLYKRTTSREDGGSRGALRIFPWGRGADPEAVYNLCLILKIVLWKSCCKYNITLCNCVYIHTNITACTITQSPRPVVFSFLTLLFYFSKL
jgi:hypothetical protein